MMAVVCYHTSASVAAVFMPFIKFGHHLSGPVLRGMKSPGTQAVMWYLLCQWTRPPASVVAMSCLPKPYFIESSLDLEVSDPPRAHGGRWTSSTSSTRLAWFS